MITNDWAKSSYSGPNGNCVEARIDNGHVLVRDSKLGAASPVLNFSARDWELFTGEIRDGFACPAGGMIEIWVAKDGIQMLHRADTTTRLCFTWDEWKAFLDGVEANEFDLQPA